MHSGARIPDEEVLRHVEREELLLADLGDGEATAITRSAIAEREQARCASRAPADPRRASVAELGRRRPRRRARSARAGAGSIVQLVSSDGSSIGRTVRSARGRRATYEAAGVSIAKADAVVERPASAVESTGARASERSRGSIARRRGRTRRVDRLGRDEAHPRRERGALRSCGADLAAHCINDVITCGADPLFFLDYVAANRIELETVAELVEGAAEVCRDGRRRAHRRRDGRAPGIYREDELDFAGTCVGCVAATELLDGSAFADGDVGRRPCRRPACTRTASRSCGACSMTRTTRATTLLAPTRSLPRRRSRRLRARRTRSRT
jgi:hypothetical protein